MFEDALEWRDRFFKSLFPGALTMAATTGKWKKLWTWVLPICLLCTLLRNTTSFCHEWLTYLPSGLIAELGLIYLCVYAPFPPSVSFWRVALLSVIGVWLPYVFQTVTSRPLAWLSAILSKVIGWGDLPSSAPPWAYGYGIRNTLVCMALTVVVLVTPGAFKLMRR